VSERGAPAGERADGSLVRLRVDLAYDGSGFAGFARQPDRRTVQGTLEGALSRVLGQPAATTCAGRTDRGVHALAQVVHVDVDPSVPRARRALARPDALAVALDRLLGPEVAVWAVRRVPAGFDARFSATGRGYRYRMADAPVLAPLARHDRWHVHGPLALGPMRAAARHLLGEHDFAAFCRRPPEGRTTVRRLDEVAISRPNPGVVDVRLVGSAFCHNQVRSIVGCLVEVGRGRRAPDWLGEVLAARDRALAARVAPPQGLVLERVHYGRRWPAAPPPAVRALLGSG
jgi:tRNA pseudouridine38-40 synthase